MHGWLSTSGIQSSLYPLMQHKKWACVRMATSQLACNLTTWQIHPIIYWPFTPHGSNQSLSTYGRILKMWTFGLLQLYRRIRRYASKIHRFY